MFKTCSKCNKQKDLEDFYKDTRVKSGRRSVCKDCWSSSRPGYQKEWREKNAQHRREYFLLKTYGITTQQYDKMLEEQNGLCKICQQPPRSRKDQRLFVDHDHKNNVVRGLLCNICNRWLGMYENNRAMFSKFDSYLGEK